MEKPLLRKSLRMGVGLLLQGRITLTFDQLLFHQQQVPFKKRLNFLLQGMRLMTRSIKRTGIPPILQIEPSNICNLKCLTCATGSGLVKRPASLMTFDMYCRVIDQVKNHVYLLAFWSWGEPFINNEAFRMIRYAKEQGLLVHTSTNGHFFNTRDKARKIIDSGLDSLIIALDGLDQLTYEKYRKGGNLKTVIDSVKNIVSERAALGVRHPRMTLRFIVMKHNEHQVDRVQQFARDLGVDVISFRSAVVRRADIDLTEDLMPHAAEFQRFDYETFSNSGKQRYNYCHRPYANLTIFSNGEVVACENDFNATFPLGNVNEQSIHKILSSRKTRLFLKAFRVNMDQFKYCKQCENRYIKGHTANVETLILNNEFYRHEKTN